MPELYVRNGKWHTEIYYWSESEHRRKRVRISTGIRDDGSARTKRIAEQSARQIAQSYATGAVRRARTLTLQAAIAIHIKAQELAQKSQSTIDIVNEKAERLIDHFGGGYDCYAITEASLSEYAAERRKQPGKLGRGIQNGTIYRELRTFREALRDAKRAKKFDGAIPDMPDIGVIYRPKERWLDKAESQRLLMAA